MARLQERYREEVFPQLQKEFGLTNPMQVPKISKITCNIGFVTRICPQQFNPFGFLDQRNSVECGA